MDQLHAFIVVNAVVVTEDAWILWGLPSQVDRIVAFWARTRILLGASIDVSSPDYNFEQKESQRSIDWQFLRIIDDGANCEDSRLILGEMEPLRLDYGLLQLIVSLEKALNRGPFIIFVKNYAGLIELHYLEALKISIHHPQRHLKCILHSFVLRRIF